MTTENTAARAAAVQGQFAPVNGLNLYYETYGQGFPLVLIHGGGSTIDTSFGRLIPLLSPHYQVIAVEMQAHGRTADRDQPLTFAQDAADVAALLAHLHIERAHVLGFSNGASTVLHLLINHPQVVAKAVVASTFYNRAGAIAGMWEMMQQASFETMPQAYKEAFLLVNNKPAALMASFRRDVERMQNFPELSSEQIAGIKVPVLIAAGDKDIVTLEHLIEMHRLIPQSQLAIFPGGHGDYMGEITCYNPAQPLLLIVPVLLRFLSGDIPPGAN